MSDETEDKSEIRIGDTVIRGKLQILETVPYSEEEDKESEVNFRTEDSDSSNDSSGSDTGDNGSVEDAKEKISEEELVDWAYKVIDWFKVAAKAKAWNEIDKHADDIITAFLVLVKEEHRGIVMEALRAVRGAM